MMYVANPIYDTVFKYLLEDRRIAGTILSALLKREVVDVVAKKHEYANITTENLSIFRIDFGATVVEPDGSKKVILIELQKTWVETETLRFRQYLSVHYGDSSNIIAGSREGFAYPMVTVYLLGHRVGDIEEPVLYVRRKAYDYEGNEVTRGIPDPFVDSLTHDSIIVQIPLLKGQMNNRLANVLNVFCQDFRSDDSHLLCIDENRFLGDRDMMHLLHRLQSAAADQKVRKEMNIEDEFLAALEKRDTEILLRDRKLAEQNVRLKEQGEQLKEQEEQLKGQEEQLKGQAEQLMEKDRILKILVKGMLKAGISVEDIADRTDLTAGEVSNIA